MKSIYLKDAWRDEILYSLFCLKTVASVVFPQLEAQNPFFDLRRMVLSLQPLCQLRLGDLKAERRKPGGDHLDIICNQASDVNASRHFGNVGRENRVPYLVDAMILR